MHYIVSFVQQPHEIGFNLPILQIGKRRHRELTVLAKATEGGLVKLEFHPWSVWLQDPCFPWGFKWQWHESKQRGENKLSLLAEEWNHGSVECIIFLGRTADVQKRKSGVLSLGSSHPNKGYVRTFSCFSSAQLSHSPFGISLSLIACHTVGLAHQRSCGPLAKG